MIYFCDSQPLRIAAFRFGIAGPKNHTIGNDTLDARFYATISALSVISAFTCLVCICGLVGNGAVIWLLGFRIKRTPFTTYILNLAVADFGVLISTTSIAVISIAEMHLLIPYHYYILRYVDVVNLFLSFFFYHMSQFLLTAISIDRCVSVLFPLWYRCRRPEKLSTVLCVLIWLLTLLIQVICLSVHFTWSPYQSLFFGILVNAVVCLPLITVSTLLLFFKFCFKSQQRQQGKLLRAVLLTLFFFLIFAFPLNIIYLILFNWYYKASLYIRCNNVAVYGWLCASLNSFVNPLLYFLVGRKKRGLCRENLKLILQRVFIDEEEACREQPGIQLCCLQKPLPQEKL